MDENAKSEVFDDLKKIVDLLLQDARMSYSDIGIQVGLSRTAVKNRVVALENKGIINGYRAIINPQEYTEMMTFIVNIETNPEHFDSAKQVLSEADEVITLIQTTGRNSHLTAICVSEDVKIMRDFVNHIYRTVDGILSINAHTVLDVIKGSIILE
jgi:DNA-binding Lrp family transcriptional regulator